MDDLRRLPLSPHLREILYPSWPFPDTTYSPRLPPDTGNVSPKRPHAPATAPATDDMSSGNISALREQILANSKLLLRTDDPGPTSLPKTTSEKLSELALEKTEYPKCNNIDVVVSMDDKKGGASVKDTTYTAAVMVGHTPAIEGGASQTVEGALSCLLVATAKLLSDHMPKVGAHQRNIRGGGVFDEVMIHPALTENHTL